VALVTGANTGIGWETAKELATHGARVILAGRSAERVAEAVKKLKAQRPTCSAEGYVVDLAQFRRARARRRRDRGAAASAAALSQPAGPALTRRLRAAPSRRS
jgi:NAD(P)-dependent dehydrogenase (short-subunit alcohol dehydrogenase family)